MYSGCGLGHGRFGDSVLGAVCHIELITVKYL